MASLGFLERKRVELIHGMVVRMSPIGPPHGDVVDLLNSALLPSLIGRARVRIQQPFVAWDESSQSPTSRSSPIGATRMPTRTRRIS